MSIRALDFAEPFFPVKYILDEKEYTVGDKCIVFNLSEEPVMINNRPLNFYRSVVATNTKIFQIKRCLIIENFWDHKDEAALLEEVKKTWPLAYDITHAERHKGVMLWRSPQVKLGNVAINMCLAGSVPLKVGLHQTHWGGPPIKEVHTQIVGVGTMQQYYENDLTTLYREEPMAPGYSHIPMYDENVEYPWHQYETVTPSIFMATEMQITDELGYE